MISVKRILVGLGVSMAAIALLPSTAAAQEITEIIGRSCQLSASDGTLQDGSRFDTHQFAGEAGQSVGISLGSTDFDPYLIVVDPNGAKVAEHDDIDLDAGLLNATIGMTLASTGVYTIYTNSYDADSFGVYYLSVSTSGTTPQQNLAIPDDCI